MDEGDLEPEHAAPRRLVDQLGACVRKMCECRANVVDLVCDVMHAGAAVREEAADRRVLAQRAQQLQPALADANGRRLDALLLDTRPMLESRSEQPLVRIERAVEILDR